MAHLTIKIIKHECRKIIAMYSAVLFIVFKNIAFNVLYAAVILNAFLFAYESNLLTP